MRRNPNGGEGGRATSLDKTRVVTWEFILKSLESLDSRNMEGSLKKYSVACGSAERRHSDAAGRHLKNCPKASNKLKMNKKTWIATHNINSLLKVGRLKDLTNILDKNEILLLALQEMRNTNREPFESQGYRVYNGIPGKRVMRQCPQFGTGFLVNLKIINSITEFNAISPRLATLTFKSSKKIYTIINVHAPTNDKNFRTETRQEVEDYWDLLDQTISRIPEWHVKILLGDFNAQLGKERHLKDVVGKYPAQEKTTRNGQRLIEVCRKYDLICKTTYFKKKPKSMKTWKHPDWKKGEWQLDHVCMDRFHHKEIQNVKSMRGTDTGSDHYMVKIKLKLTPPKKSTMKPQNIRKKKYDSQQLINNQSYKELTNDLKETELREVLPKLQDIAEKTAPINKRKKHEWWNDVCEAALETRHQKWLTHHNNNTEQSHDDFLKQRKETQKIIRNVRRRYQMDLLEQIETDYKKLNTRNYYKMFKKQLTKYESPTLILQYKNGTMAHNNKDNAEILAEAFNELLNCEDPTDPFDIDTDTKIKTPQGQILPPTPAEVQAAMKEMKNNKSSGEDATTTEIWKYASRNIQEILHQNLVTIWEKEELPEEWTNAVICPLHKKGDKSNPDNYRGISLLDCTYKIFSRVIYNKIKEQLDAELGDYQGGFRPWRSCADQVLTLKLIIDYYKRRSKQLMIAFIDFKKAYDCIHRASMLRILRNLGLDPKLVRLIGLTLSGTKSRVKFRGEYSQVFEIRTGLRQGDGLSPLLFNCALEYIIRKWRFDNPENVRCGGSQKNFIKVNCLGFADDLVLLGESVAEVRRQTVSLENLAAKIGLKISYGKTKIMAINPLVIDRIKISDNWVEIVEQFKYLGETISYNGNESFAWKARSNKFMRAQKSTRDTYNKKSLSIGTKIRHYKTVIQPEVTYCSETLTELTKKNRIQKVQMLERRMLRTCIGKKVVRDGVWHLLPTREVHKKIEPVTDTMRKKRIFFLGHIIRTPQSRVLRRLIEYMWDLKSGPSWIREVKKDLAELELTKEDLKSKSDNLNAIKNINIRFKEILRKQSNPRVLSDAERAARSERMKRYWEGVKKERAKKKPRPGNSYV